MADLYIRWSTANPKDDGTRPISPCWPPNAVWTNASIWMSYPPSHPDPAKRNTTAYEARIDEEVFINVDVYSNGADFVFPGPDQLPIRCQVWACSGANGVGPISSLASTNGQLGIETLVVGSVGPLDYYSTATVLWTPRVTDGLTFDANGAAHICLAANLVYDAPGGLPPGAPRAQGQHLPGFMSGGQPVTTVFPCGDGPTDPRSLVPIGHFQGQKNIQVLTAASSQGLKRVVEVFGSADREELRLLEITERAGNPLEHAIVREHLLAYPFVELDGGRERRQRFREVTTEMLEAVSPTLGLALPPAGTLPAEPRERARLAGGGELVLAANQEIALRSAERPLPAVTITADNGERGSTLRVRAEPRSVLQIAVDLSDAGDDPPGTVRVFDLVERSRGQALIGGSSFVTLALS